MALGVRKEEEEIIKPRNDKREYRRIVLQNNLHVLLISDADTDKCAASMDVRVGSFSDPEGLGGLAHFPATSAFTSSEHTNYYFDVNPDGFEEALDRWNSISLKKFVGYLSENCLSWMDDIMLLYSQIFSVFHQTTDVC
ncbi:hypothetical protein ACS0TY_025656 [Phlomoides rotata]